MAEAADARSKTGLGNEETAAEARRKNSRTPDFATECRILTEEQAKTDDQSY